MWSFGCIIYELFTGVPLFQGENELEQMHFIMEVKGIPPVSVIKQGSRWRTFFHSNLTPREMSHSHEKYTPNSKKLKDLLNTDDKDFIDFIEKCLEWEVENRLTPRKALMHNWIKAGLNELTKSK